MLEQTAIVVTTSARHHSRIRSQLQLPSLSRPHLLNHRGVVPSAAFAFLSFLEFQSKMPPLPPLQGAVVQHVANVHCMQSSGTRRATYHHPTLAVLEPRPAHPRVAGATSHRRRRRRHPSPPPPPPQGVLQLHAGTHQQIRQESPSPSRPLLPPRMRTHRPQRQPLAAVVQQRHPRARRHPRAPPPSARPRRESRSSWWTWSRCMGEASCPIPHWSMRRALSSGSGAPAATAAAAAAAAAAAGRALLSAHAPAVSSEATGRAMAGAPPALQRRQRGRRV